MAEEFVPLSLVNHALLMNGCGFGNNYAVVHNNNFRNGHDNNGRYNGRWKNGYVKGRRRMNSRTSMAQQEEVIRMTFYVSDIDQQVASWNSHLGVATCLNWTKAAIFVSASKLLTFWYLMIQNTSYALWSLKLDLYLKLFSDLCYAIKSLCSVTIEYKTCKARALLYTSLI